MEHKNLYLSPIYSSSTQFLLLFFCFFLLTGVSVSTASAFTSISDGVFEDRASFGRNLLQAKQSCPVNFEFLNYTIITSQCKGPLYLPNLCCPAFKEFACPYVDYLNDLSNDCATIMFSYINLYGKYPPGLFSSECREGKLGLACNATSPSLSATATGNETIPGSSLMLALLTMGFLLLLL
ncbi:hypothetical protein Vadar_007489 [Vaccinium darrowii]|uniref:Uncharacterized protein n=1 Tax=Vaccinium darrowii TaxID=229202 RepID=A0ACB7XNV8_9ERIC|nr:hypothetical protein Vadar_007489 [Vaccinium darrowii]